MNEQQYEDIVALGNKPISDDSKFGQPVRYEEVFEQLEAEMEKLGSLSGDQPNWNTVADLGKQILREKSKDMLVMTYLTVALFETDGYAGLRAAFDAYTAFIKNFWEGCYPKVKPPHGRYNAVQYLADRIGPLVEDKGGQIARAPAANEKEAVHQCADAVNAFDDAVTEVFTGQPDTPNLLPLARSIKKLKEKVGPLQEEQPPASESPPQEQAATAEQRADTPPAQQPQQRPSQLGTGGGGGAAVPDSFSSTTQAVQSVIKIAKYLIGEDAKDGRGYRLARAVHFGALSGPPKDRVIPAPPKPRRAHFEKLASDANWQQLLTDAEGQFATTPLWLDMQRYVALAAESLGGPYKGVRDSVAFEAVALFQRLPEVFELSFKDGSGFADGATKAWVEEQAGAMGGGGGASGGGGGDALAKSIGDAKKLMAGAKSDEAVALLAELMQTARGQRERYRAQIGLAGILIDLKKWTLARSLLEDVEQAIVEHELERWEPQLAADATRDLYSCLINANPKAKPTPDELQRRADVFARLCRLAPAVAMKLEAKESS